MENCSNICRACLTAAESFSYFIYENITPETYLFCTSIEVKCDDFPKSLCGRCYKLLKKFSEFKQICIQSEEKLLRTSNNLKLEQGTCSYLKEELNDSSDQENAVVYVKEEESQENFGNDADFHDDDIDTYNVDTSCASQKKKNSSKTKQNGLKLTKVRKKSKFYLECELCNKKFVLKARFEAHKLKHEGKTAPIKCNLCNKPFASWSGLRRHLEATHSALSFKELTCKTCSKVCKNPQSLKAHHKTHEQRGGVIICDECGNIFKSRLTLKNHLETHIKNREQSFTCQHCGKKYMSKKTRAKHIYRTHTDRRFICDYCNYQFSDKTNLVKHILSHEGKQRLYKCDICLRVLTSQGSLNVHRRIHTGERPFSCSYCPKRFSNKGWLVDHHRIHTGEKPFKCSVCDQCFTRRGTMKRHMKMHDRLCA